MKVIINQSEYDLQPKGLEIREHGDRILIKTDRGLKSALVVKRGDSTFVSFEGKVYEAIKPKRGGQGSAHGGSGELRTPMPGQIVEISVKVDDLVVIGQKIAVLEAMKMQQPLIAGIEGTVTELNVNVGDQVDDSHLVARIVPNE